MNKKPVTPEDYRRIGYDIANAACPKNWFWGMKAATAYMNEADRLEGLEPIKWNPAGFTPLSQILGEKVKSILNKERKKK